MFKKKAFDGVEGFDTLIGVHSTFEGNLETEGIIRVDGRVKGDLKVNGDVYVGNQAVITGNIHANNVNLAGTVEGNVHAKGVLRILSSAKLFGDMHVHSFVADEGGIFQGKCSMVEVPVLDSLSDKNASRKQISSRDFKKNSVIGSEQEEA
jgi:cytoskeletal protein CcmA (bactofilin family)